MATQQQEEYVNGFNAARRMETKIPADCTDVERWLEGYQSCMIHRVSMMRREWQLDRMMEAPA